MRALIQRVEKAHVAIDGEITGSIERGLLVFLGVGSDDSQACAEKLWNKIYKLRIFPDNRGHATGFSLADIEGDALVISQFTLYADCKKGNRPSFMNACPPDRANELYEYFCEYARKDVPRLQTGSFGADMQVSLINDGPFTIWLDTATL